MRKTFLGSLALFLLLCSTLSSAQSIVSDLSKETALSQVNTWEEEGKLEKKMARSARAGIKTLQFSFYFRKYTGTAFYLFCPIPTSCEKLLDLLLPYRMIQKVGKRIFRNKHPKYKLILEKPDFLRILFVEEP